MAAIFRPWVKDRKTGKTVRSPKYVVQFRHPATRKKVRVFLGVVTKRAAEKEAAKVIERAELEHAGVIAPADSRQLSALLTEFLAAMTAKGRAAKHTQHIDTNLTALFARTGWTYPQQMTGQGLEEAMTAIRSNGRGERNANALRTYARQFARWLRIDPFRDVARHSTKAAEVHPRRPLTVEEARHLLKTVKASPIRIQNHDGESRYWAYRLAMATGLRAGEMQSLTADSFDWSARIVRVTSKRAKNRTEALQPLPSTIMDGLRAFLRGRSGRIWKLTRASEMLQADLAAAGIPYRDAEGRCVDFHSLRHFYGNSLAASGVPIHEAQRLMRHSDVRLTISLYRHATAQQLRSSVDSLPIL